MGDLVSLLRTYSERAYETAVQRGFYEEDTQDNLEKSILGLVTEAVEVQKAIRIGHRANPKQYLLDSINEFGVLEPDSCATAYCQWMKDTEEAELASVIVNALSIAKRRGIDIGFFIEEEMRFNEYRASGVVYVKQFMGDEAHKPLGKEAYEEAITNPATLVPEIVQAQEKGHN
jgi:NTP pyrophosphatase (non-canonical NTP hydrolase)